jgi:uroporphyrinogen decarboxylase
MLDEKIIEEDEHTKIYTDKYGITKKVRKDTISTPLEIARPIKNRADFEKYKTHYTRDFSRRLPENWKTLSAELRDRDFPIRLGGNPYGFFGLPRHLMGDTKLMMMMYDEPRLVKDINEFFLDFIMDYWSHIFETFIPDCCLFWEDMCFKGASMISGKMFEEFLTPYYFRIIDFLKQYGIKTILVDSDGYVEELIPLWLKAGVTVLLPFEIQAGNDLLRIRDRYPKLQILGGIDKMVLAKDKNQSDIDRELEKVKILLSYGGYIPHIDHYVSEDACWDNFKYYRRKLNEIIDSL